MPANFPNNPATNQLYSYSGATWKFTGTKWQLVTVTDGNTGTLFTYSNTAPQAPSLGDRWLNSETLRQSIYINDGDTDQWVEPVSIGLAGAAKSLNNLANVSINTDLLPAANVTHDLGSSSLRWRDLYLSGNSIILGAATLTSTGSAVNLPAGTTVGGQNVATSGDVSTGGGPKITNLQITDNSWAVLDDTAVDTAGGYVLITGTNFVSGALVYLNQTPATSVAFVSATTLRVTVPALTAGTYVVYVINPDGGTAIRVPGLTASANPAWQTASALPEQYDGAEITLNLVATDATSYTLVSGSLPPGLSLNSNTGVITGTVTGVTVDTVYTFTVRATDAQLQDSPRTFTVTITVSDPYFKLTTLLLSGSAISANTVVRDSSTNNFNLTVAGDSRASNFTPYGSGWSVYFDGASDYLDVAANSAFALGTGDFTVEVWVQTTTISADTFYRRVYMTDGPTLNAGGNFQITIVPTSGYVNLWDSVLDLVGTINVCDGLWHHIAATRSGTTLRLFVDGIINGSTTYSTSVSPNAGAPGPRIGSYDGTSGDFNGYISNLRVVKGTALYTANFTPATTNLTSVANTSLLTCNANRFLDGSTNNFTITRNGDARVVSFNPFNITNTGVNGSMYFDGSGDYIQAANSANLDVGTGDFSIEAWCYKTNTSTATDWRVMGGSVSSSGFFGDGGTSSSRGFGIGRSGVAWDVTSNVQAPIYEWFHICYTRKSGAVRIFLNGKLIAYATGNTNNYGLNAGTLQIAAEQGGIPLTGYLTDFRLFKTVPAGYDTAATTINTQVFTPPTSPLTAITNTQLLTCQYDQPHNNHTFLDSSSNQFLITRSGNASQGTFSPFSPNGWSNYFLGRLGTNLNLASNAGLAIGSGQFCVEAWVYVLPQTLTSGGYGTGTIISQGNNNNNNHWWLAFNNSTGVISWGYTGSGITVSTSYPVVKNTWTHIAVTRDASNGERIFLNGVLVNHRTNTTNYSSVNGYQVQIGTNYDSNYPGAYGFSAYANPFSGYINNLRIVVGSIPTAYQTASTTLGASIFTPPLSDLTAIPGTILLTCQNNRFKDNSVNNWTISKSGSDIISVQTFSPFEATAVYSPVSHGGSAYFDGTGDCLAVPDNELLDLGTSNFTIELWIYLTASVATAMVLAKTPNSSTYGSYEIRLSSTTVVMFLGSTGSSWDIASAVGTGTTSLNSWTHIALVRSASTFTLYVNGNASGTATSSSSLFNNTSALGIAANPDASYPYTGYISNFRVIKGTALYTSNFTPPTAPLTTTNNTSLLLNFTDSAIIDSTGRTVLETVADAKTSSVVTKFTGGSMYFDGTGDYLLTAPIQIAASNENFTIEYWFYATGNGTGWGYHLSTAATTGTNANSFFLGWDPSSGRLGGNWANASNRFPSGDGTFAGTTCVLNTWYHVALVRISGVMKIYLNGTASATTWSVSDALGLGSGFGDRLAIGYNRSQNAYFSQGYIQDVRITRGYARYTADFTAPTTPARLK